MNNSVKTALAQERAMTRRQVILKAIRGEITWIAAAEILRVTARQVRRIRKRYEIHGEAGFADNRIGRNNCRRHPEKLRENILAMYRREYFDLSVQHFHEKLIENHEIKVSYTWVKSLLQENGLATKYSMREKHRIKRERRPMTGMLLHLDGSTHAWLGEEHGNFDLLAVVDDATTEVYAAKFVPQEDTRSALLVLKQTIEAKGIFCSLYTDRAMHFAVTLKAGERPDRARPTQVSSALDKLGIELITAYSPQARGRGERLWKTWQGRLPQELRLEKCKTIDQANEFLIKKFIPWHNKTFTVTPKESSTAFIQVHSGVNLNQIFSICTKRTVNLDNTVNYKTLKLQIPKSELRFSFATCKVTVHEHLDQTLSVTYGPHILAYFTKKGELINSIELPKRKAA